LDEIGNHQNSLDQNVVAPDALTQPSWVDKAVSSVYVAGQSALQNPCVDSALTAAMLIGAVAYASREEIVPLSESLAENGSKALTAGRSDIADLHLIDLGEPETRTITVQIAGTNHIQTVRPSLIPELAGGAGPARGTITYPSHETEGQIGGFH
jgi:hypothetical protein